MYQLLGIVAAALMWRFGEITAIPVLDLAAVQIPAWCALAAVAGVAVLVWIVRRSGAVARRPRRTVAGWAP